MLAVSLLKEIPPSPELRQTLRDRAIAAAAERDPSRAPTWRDLEQTARNILHQLEEPEAYAGWTMVALVSAFWSEQISAVPPHRRLLLLPHCLRHAEKCRAETDEQGLACLDCGACDLTSLRAEAERRGYKVMIAEGSPAVLRVILSGQIDAVQGVACLDALEKTFDKILLAGIPCQAVPLLTADCVNTTAETAWIREMIHAPHRPAPSKTQTYVHLMRAAAALCEREQLDWLASTNGDSTASLARDFLAAGGKHFRPFVTLAAYDAMTGGRSIGPDGAAVAATIPQSVRRAALAIEVFHKASLIHDDIEDDDPFRYGRPTLHREHGVPVALNAGDFLIGLGYRLVAEQREGLGAEAVADILEHLARAHTRLCEGQGAELAWRAARRFDLAPLDVLKIYALKTAPAFEAALYAGIRAAGPAEEIEQAAARFAKHLGVAYQIVNDLEDWQVDEQNKRTAGADILAGRPTVLLALALERLSPADRAELETLAATGGDDAIARADELYRRAGVFPVASELIGRHRDRALAAIDNLEPKSLRAFLEFLADALLGSAGA